MRDSMHVVSRLNLKEKKVVVRNSSSMKERSVNRIAQVLVNGKVPRLACWPLVGTDEVEA
jgi:hypothetical protein